MDNKPDLKLLEVEKLETLADVKAAIANLYNNVKLGNIKHTVGNSLASIAALLTNILKGEIDEDIKNQLKQIQEGNFSGDTDKVINEALKRYKDEIPNRTAADFSKEDSENNV